MQRGTVRSIRPLVSGDRLRVVAAVVTETGALVEATLPDRELAAILPRSVLVGPPAAARRSPARAPMSLLDTIAPILSRMAEGRVVRMWDYQGRSFFSFLPWKGVRFIADAPAAGGPGAAPAP
jgi:hypothetical protein